MPIRELFTRGETVSKVLSWRRSPWLVFGAVQFAGVVLGMTGAGPHGDPTVWLAALLSLPGVLALIPLGSLPDGWLVGGEILGSAVIVSCNTILFWVALKIWRKYS